MRVIMTFSVPHQRFNQLVREGLAGPTVGRLIEETKPEQIYLFEQDGTRAGVAIYHIEKSNDTCRIAEPWFLALHAECKFAVAMTPEELAEVDLAEIGRKWC